MKLGQLVQLMRELVSKIEDLEGYLFLDRFGEGRQQLLKKISKYDDPSEAQRWINIVLIDQAITAVIGDEWEMSDAEINELLAVFEQAWVYQIKASFPEAEFKILRIIDDEYGDVGLRLTSEKLDANRNRDGGAPASRTDYGNRE